MQKIDGGMDAFLAKKGKGKAILYATLNSEGFRFQNVFAMKIDVRCIKQVCIAQFTTPSHGAQSYQRFSSNKRRIGTYFE